jgi:hypothetical protein
MRKSTDLPQIPQLAMGKPFEKQPAEHEKIFISTDD